jgi:murein DD-endopeptidase MepM/ murein hydrolase activator NlpD
MGLRRAITTLAAAALATTTGTAAEEATDAPGRWTWPLGPAQTAIVHAFDPPQEPWQPGHRGVDLAGVEGSTVYAAGDGLVTYAGLVAGVGVVTVTHGELRTTYQPVAPAVAVGQRVEAGQQIGTLDMAASHCAPSACLHWGLLRGEVYLDPASLIPPAARPRLLPLGSRALGGDHTDDIAEDGQATIDAAAEPVGLVASGPAGVSGQVAMGALAGIRG